MKIYVKISLVLLFQLFTNTISDAQNYLNVLNIRYYYMPENTIKTTDKDVNIKDYRIESALPKTLKDSNIIGIKIQYKSITISSDNADLKELNLHSLKLPIFMVIKYKNRKWSSYFEVAPKLNSDFNDITLRHFQIGGTVLFFYEKKPGFLWQFGVFYNQDTYGPFFMPLLGFDWKISEKSDCSVLLPAYMIFEQKISKKLYTGFEMEITGETYRLGGSSEYPNSFISQLGANKLMFLAEPRLFLDFYLAKHLVFYIKPGFRLFQKYEHFTEDDHIITNSKYVQGKFKNSFYAEAGIALRFRYDEK